MNNDLPYQQPADDAFEEELVFTFLSDCRAFEQALVRAGFARAGRAPGDLRPDWERFARHIEGKFDPDSTPELIGSVLALLEDPDNPNHFRKRPSDPYLMEPSDPEHNTTWLAERVQQVRNQILSEINFAGKADCDLEVVTAATIVVEAWSHLDPRVESLLANGE